MCLQGCLVDDCAFTAQRYIFCRWYAACGVLALVYFITIAFTVEKFRKGALQICFIGTALVINNYYTPELAEMCKLNSKVDLPANEIVIHGAGVVVLMLFIYRFTYKRKQEENNV